VVVQALVQYPEGVSATNAMNALEGHAIYDGGYNKVPPAAIPPSLSSTDPAQ